jgi:hypothetical protein
MKNDPGLFTDSTGEGMSGAEDVALETQRDLKNTQYNGSKVCTRCGGGINPVQSLLDQKTCPSCTRRQQVTRVKGRMA